MPVPNSMTWVEVSKNITIKCTNTNMSSSCVHLCDLKPSVLHWMITFYCLVGISWGTPTTHTKQHSCKIWNSLCMYNHINSQTTALVESDVDLLNNVDIQTHAYFRIIPNAGILWSMTIKILKDLILWDKISLNLAHLEAISNLTEFSDHLTTHFMKK